MISDGFSVSSFIVSLLANSSITKIVPEPTYLATHSKGNTYREVPLNAEVRTALDAWLENRSSNHESAPMSLARSSTSAVKT